MAGKNRGNGEGTVTQRKDGRWEARLTLTDGRRKCLYGKTRAEAARRLAVAIRDQEKGVSFARDERQSLASYLRSWLETLRPPTLKPRTWGRYESDVRVHLIPALGSTRLLKLSAQQVQAFYAAKRREGRLAPASIAHLHAVLHSALEQAERLGLVPRNVADLVKAPRPSAEHEMHVLTPEQAQTLLDAASGDRLEALYVLALTTGMRLGELLALRWRDVDLDTATLHVLHTLHHEQFGAWKLTRPKTAKSRLRIALTPRAVEALHSRRVRQAEERLALGEAWADHGFIFTRQDGEPLRGTHVLERGFHPLLQRAGLPLIRFHDLRHTCATLLLVQNVPAKVVSELLGHSSVAITLDRYSHVLPSMQQSAAAAMEQVLKGIRVAE
jgi:integrase